MREYSASMTPFDYLNVLIAIILGLAIARALTGVAIVITARERVDFYWPPVVWAIWIFFICVEHWWAQWGIRKTTTWTFLEFSLLLIVPVLLFLLASLILPERIENETVDLGQWYFRNRAWFFAIMFFVPAVSILEEIVRSGHMANNVNLAFLLAFEVVIAVAFVLRSPRAQEWICGQAMIMTLVYVGLLYFGFK